ncbi:MAG: hypothetical protein L0211_26965 [Planctomycetaceae bacterium]|nr:hypothetical protein [Planctomycetaceae bacterium]
MTQIAMQIAGWIAAIGFFAFFYWYMCKRQAADARRRGEHAGGPHADYVE